MGSLAPPPAPSPRSPPRLSVLGGRHRLPAEVETANREITFLQEELQSLDGLQTVSRCCKEVDEFVGSNPDPLVPLSKKKHQSSSTWKWLRAKLCFSCICCCSCPCRQHANNCCCNCEQVLYCRLPCLRPSGSCFGCSCGCTRTSCPNCMNVCYCCRCTNSSCCSKQCLC